MQTWYKFAAWNSQSLYGYGTLEEAEAYCEILNNEREINVYAPYELSDEEIEAFDIDNNDLGFSIADNLE